MLDLAEALREIEDIYELKKRILLLDAANCEQKNQLATAQQNMVMAQEQLQNLKKASNDYYQTGNMFKIMMDVFGEHDNLREMWTDLLMAMKLQVPDIEEQFANAKKAFIYV